MILLFYDLAISYILGTTDSSLLQTFASLFWSGMMHVLMVPSTLASMGTKERKAPEPYGLLSFDTHSVSTLEND